MNYQSRDVNPASFISLPDEIVEEIGLTVNRGVKLDVIVLSCFSYYYVINLYTETYQRIGDTLIQKPKGVFILSARRVSKNIYFRFFGKNPDEKGDHFRQLYERVRKAVQRLEKDGYIERVGYVNPAKGPRAGIYWTLKGKMKKIQHINYRVYLWNQDTINVDSSINTIGDLFRAQSYEDYNTMLYRCGYNKAQYIDYMLGIRSVAENKMNFSRHRGIGAYQDQYYYNEFKPVYIPFFTIDIDSEYVEESFEVFKRNMESFTLQNIDTSRFIKSPTGGNGFHIEIPAGHFGNPVFRNADQAFNTVKYVMDEFLIDEVDTSRFNPVQNIRMIGSVHEETGRYKIPIRDHEMDNVENILRISSQFRRSRIRHPATAKPQPAFIEKITKIMSGKFSFTDVKEYKDNEEIGGDVIHRILKGVEEGEAWHGRHVGRSKAAYVLGCHLIRKHGVIELPKSWIEMQEWNKKNTPPLSTKELQSAYRSSLNRVRKDGEI